MSRPNIGLRGYNTVLQYTVVLVPVMDSTYAAGINVPGILVISRLGMCQQSPNGHPHDTHYRLLRRTSGLAGSRRI